MVGPQLTAGFHKEAGGATLPGDTVLVVGLPSLQSKGVFFLNLLPWDNNQHGVAIQVNLCVKYVLVGFCAIRFVLTVSVHFCFFSNPL